MAKLAFCRARVDKIQAPARILVVLRHADLATHLSQRGLYSMVSRNRDYRSRGRTIVFSISGKQSFAPIEDGNLSSAWIPGLKIFCALDDSRSKFEALLVLGAQRPPRGAKNFQGHSPSDQRQNTKRDINHV